MQNTLRAWALVTAFHHVLMMGWFFWDESKRPLAWLIAPLSFTLVLTGFNLILALLHSLAVRRFGFERPACSGLLSLGMALGLMVLVTFLPGAGFSASSSLREVGFGLCVMIGWFGYGLMSSGIGT